MPVREWWMVRRSLHARPRLIGSAALLGVWALAGCPGSTGSSGDFDPRVHGFGFENYTNEEMRTNLTEADVWRLFGDGVCERGSGEGCELTTPARQWMEQASSEMRHGHCEGMAVLSLRMFRGDTRVTDFGAATANALAIDDNERLQREIAYWFSIQSLEPYASTELHGTPMEQVERLRTSFADGRPAYTIGFFQRDETGGHAVAPYDVRERDDGNLEILVYDNNAPNEERAIVVDPMANTWSYRASTDPSVTEGEYEGDATTDTLRLGPLAAREGRMTCPFCGERTGDATAQRRVDVDGDASARIVDAEGRQVGHVGDEVVNDIPGAQVIATRSGDLWDDREEPTYALPNSGDLEIFLSGEDRAAEDASLGVYAPGLYVGIEGLLLAVGQTDRVRLYAGGEAVTYETSGMETPDVVLAYSTDAADWLVVLRSRGDSNGQTLDAQLNAELGLLFARFTRADAESQFDLYVLRVDGSTELEFFADMIAVPNGARLTLHYGTFDADGDALVLDVDVFGDGTMVESVDLLDEAGGL